MFSSNKDQRKNKKSSQNDLHLRKELFRKMEKTLHFMQYMMSLLYYGSHQLLICKNTTSKMERSVDYDQYKALIVKQLKQAL